MLENAEHPKVVQEMLGHANISQTLNTYSHVTPKTQPNGWIRCCSERVGVKPVLGVTSQAVN
jgi:hypothetical protein